MLLTLTNVPRDYAWGSSTLLADLEGRPPAAGLEAEVWFGDHPGDPADIEGGGGLDAVTGGSLPYLLKLLAAASPLSIQVHPTLAQARDGWEREAALAADDPRRNYRDDNHKPELLVALSDRFESLSGLRPISETLRLLDVLGDDAAVAELRARLTAPGDVLSDTIGWLLSGEAQRVVDAVVAAVRDAVEEGGGEWAATLRAVSGIADAYPGDSGVLVALLMNYVVLARGEGIFLRAGLLHAYVSGLGVEIMAASDNVLRGGLTPKRIDVPELLSVLDTETGVVPVLIPVAHGAVAEYPVPVPDFALRRVNLTGTPVRIPLTGPTMVLATAGRVEVGGGEAVRWGLRVGAVAFATVDEETLTLAGEGEAFIASPGR